MRRSLALILATVAALTAACSSRDTVETEPDAGSDRGDSVVVRVVDGDTIVVELDGAEEKVRLIGIDTPESVAEDRPDQCYGEEASLEVQRLIPPGTSVLLERDIEPRDQYGRLLAYVYRAADGVFVNEVLVRDGFAGTLTYPPNDTYADRFRSLEATARQHGTGLWSACGGPDEPLE